MQLTGAPRAVTDRVIERTLELATIPAPPLREARRAEVVRGWWLADGLSEVRLDTVGNVWACVRDGEGPAVVVAAHLDTVFEEDVPHGVIVEAGRATGPGVGDNTVAVAALATLATLLPEDSDAPAAPVWVVATIGEEGIGDLAGARAAVAAPPVPIAAFVALEGNYLGRVAITAVGSHRWRVSIAGPGGHAWERSEAPSAVHAAAGLVAAIVRLPRPAGGRCAINVGRIEGGEAINARARYATFELDVRSADADALDVLVRGVQEILTPDNPVLAGLTTESATIGQRPAGSIAADHPMVAIAEAALRAAGIEPRRIAASTDANAAIAAGIPAITIGVTVGEGEHTPQEWIDLTTLGAGLDVLAVTVRRIMEEVAR